MPFIAFEGLDASGKSTLIKGLSHRLKSLGLSMTLTREPGGTPLADEIRQLLLRVDGESPVSRAELLLYQAGRAQHVEKLIRPALNQNHWVICDRFTASSVAFQAGGRGLDLKQIEWLNQFATGGLEPDLFILLDLKVEESFKRMQKRGDAKDRFENEKSDFHQRVRDSFLEQAKSGPTKWLVLDASQSSEVLLEQLIEELVRRKWLAS